MLQDACQKIIFQQIVLHCFENILVNFRYLSRMFWLYFSFEEILDAFLFTWRQLRVLSISEFLLHLDHAEPPEQLLVL